ncbi:hypothetical protein TUMEXPCC7403_14410 [Tumidithrix helvetica PCC 7403]|uniref:DUF1830 domain-containing protein n=1 Tax=Tumidithrix helvetica TaxID=3457545 RepID=UPI003C874C32
MTYLLSLIGTESSIDRSKHFLCYYINNAMNIQIVRVISEAKCLFDRVVFSRESILFTALPESYLEIHSPLIDGIRLSRVDCRLLHVNEVNDLAKSFAKVPN